jgi:hypothetical protein
MVCAPLIASLYFCHIVHRYGASGDDAEKFEAATAALFPQLTMMQPDLLCNLVTQIPPQDLVKHGCRIVRVSYTPPPLLSILSVTCVQVRLVQRRGEFVVTFPRA